MANLSDFTFTQESDVVATFNDPIENNSLIETLNGDDSIESFIQSESIFNSFGIENNSAGIINMGKGNDSLIGENETSEFVTSIGIGNSGTINTGQDNDSVNGSGKDIGIGNSGTINTGLGDDSVNGSSGEDTGIGRGINNNGTISTGLGNDSVSGSGENTGISNFGTISTGLGNDSVSGSGENTGISNFGTISTGQGDDSINRDGSIDAGITNEQIINTDKGNDFLVGSSITKGIINSEIIDTGQGNDLIEGKALPGQENDSEDVGITNSGTIISGAGNDTVSGIVETVEDSSGFFIGQGTGIINNGKIAMGDGEDVLNGGEGDFGIINDGEIAMGDGHDSIEGTSSFGTGIINNETITTGNGNDTLIGAVNGFTGGRGIINNGAIDTGEGDDSLVGAVLGLGIINNGAIDTGEGNDTLIGESGAEGIAIENQGTISTGNGNDFLDNSGLIINEGTISTGNGNDALFTISVGTGISNGGLIDMGAGNDSLSADSADTGVFNNGLIKMGAGNDSLIRLGNNRTVNMGTGEDLVVIDEFNSFGESGFINLGRGDDVIEGFGNQTVDGGAGFDTGKFDFNTSQVNVSIIDDDSLVIEGSDGEMTFTDVELFQFEDAIFNFDNGSFEKISDISNLDFDEGDLAAGTIVTDQFEGVDISTSSPFGLMIFDTFNPTGGDDDLSSFVGNVLIISEDGDSSDPDDNADGGTISIEFDKVSTVISLELLDIDEPGSSIELFDDNSNLIEEIEIPAFFDGSLRQIDINVANVASLDINLAESGALTELNFFESID